MQVIKSRFRQLVFEIAVQIKELERTRGNNSSNLRQRKSSAMDSQMTDR